MEPADGDSPPFWPQTTIPTNRSRRHHSQSPLLNPALLIILIPIAALLLLFFLLPPFLSLTSQIFKPNNNNNAVKKSWDSLIVLLVLFAILCGIFARKIDDDGESTSTDVNYRASNSSKMQQSGSHQWFDQFSDHLHHHQKIYNNTSSGTGVNRLRRSSSSYPDLRQDSQWGTSGGGGDDRFRFFDDFELNRYRSPPISGNSGHRRRPSMEEVSEIKVIPVDKFELRSSPAPPSPSLSPPPPPKSPAPPPPPPPPVQRQRPRRTTYQSVSRKEKVENKRTRSPPLASTPPPPPPPPPPMLPRSEEDYVRIERKKSNATKEIKMVLASIYNQRKRKKKQKTKTIYDDSLHSPPSSLNSGSRHPPPSPAPPPPPPPPPPPSVLFYNLFKKGSKSKRVHSVPPTPPPPPPPPSSSTQSSKCQSKIQPPSTPSPPPTPPTPEASRRRNSTSAGRPPLPTRINSIYDRYENVNSGGQSPFIPMPPPPPPPFQMPEMMFSVRGDYVKIRSSHSSRCSSPELEDVDYSSKSEKSDAMDGGDVVRPSVSCPSPDVNIKADTFIARLRDEWKLEKINSLKGKQKLGHV